MRDNIEDEARHGRLLEDIKAMDGKTKRKARKRTEKLEVADLLGSIKSTRNLAELKKKLEPPPSIKPQKGRKRQASDTVTQSDKPASSTTHQHGSDTVSRALPAPLHRQAQRRIESEMAYHQSRQELDKWNPVVRETQVAEQIHFPLGEPKGGPNGGSGGWRRAELGEEKAKAFEPRTELERLTAEVLGQSKYNLRNEDAYCEAEREILKAMSVKEARRKCAELQRNRALMSYKAAKYRREKQIKSKQYHRIRKKQRRREAIKEMEGLMLRDPKKAEEKLDVLHKDRAYERATLKHRGASKWTQHIRTLASKNPEMKKLMEKHLQLGIELKRKLDVDGENSDDDEKSEAGRGELAKDEMAELAHLQSERGSALQASTTASSNSTNPFLRSALQNVRREQKRARKEPSQGVAPTETISAPSAETDQQSVKIDDDWRLNQSRLAKWKESKKVKNDTSVEGPSSTSTHIDHEKSPDLDLKGVEALLKLPSKEILHIPQELMTAEETSDERFSSLDQAAFLAEAYEDEDVMAEFVAKKQRIEGEEQPKSVDRTLYGWGSWTGQGIVDKPRFIEKPKILARKDASTQNLIIRENVSKGVEGLQPRDVPFPFTTVADYETAIQQPLGKDWNTPLAQQKLVQPRVVTRAGTIIRPMEKKMKLRKGDADFVEASGESSEE